MFTAKLNNPNNTFVLGWKEGLTFVFSEDIREVEIPDDAKEYLETYLDITNRPIFTFVKKEEIVTPIESTEKKIIKKAVE